MNPPSTQTAPGTLASQPIIFENLGDTSQVLEQLSCESLFIVADPIVRELKGVRRFLENLVTSRSVTVFQDFNPNPTYHELIRGVLAYREAQPDVVMAIGGGTAIDLAKLIGFGAVQSMDLRDFLISMPHDAKGGAPLIAVPTTAGTGSEATHFAVIYIDCKKYSVAHPSLLPKYVILDPSLTETMPANITADVGLDAFSQAVESMWSVNSTEESVRYAAEAIRLAWDNLEAAVRHPQKENRAAMSRASHLAGKAINISKTTAPHAISYRITSKYGVPHGRAVALTLGATLFFNSEVTESDCTDPRGPGHVRQTIDEMVRLLGFSTAQDAQQGLLRFIASLDCPVRLSDVGITEDAQLDEIVECVNLERLANNPRRLTSESLRTLLQSLH